MRNRLGILTAIVVSTMITIIVVILLYMLRLI